jgi:hypothetical protein
MRNLGRLGCERGVHRPRLRRLNAPTPPKTTMRNPLTHVAKKLGPASALAITEGSSER